MIEISSAIVNESQQINKVFENQNKSAKLKQELSDIKTEQSYFEEQCINNNISDIKCKTDIKSSLLLKLWTRFELQNKGINRIFNMILFLFCFGLNNRQYLKFKNDIIVSIAKRNYYTVKINETELLISQTQTELDQVNAKTLLNSYVENSSVLFKDFLYKKYGNNTERKIFELKDLSLKPQEFVNEYPIVLSTTYSSRNNLGTPINRYNYDYVIMDEASQVDVATGTVALSVAKNAVIVGDRQQLPNVITELDKKKTKIIFKNFKLKRAMTFQNTVFCHRFIIL